MTILFEKEYFYASCKGTNPTNYFRKQHQQRRGCLYSLERHEKNQKGNLPTDNKRNGHSTKTLKSQYGEFQVDIPRDRNGEFEPKLIPKYQRDISGIEEKVISLYGRGMSTRDIHDQLQDLYGIEISAEMVSKITDKILPAVKEWQARPLNPVYPFVFMDCIHYKVREDGRILSRAAYVVLGVTVEGYKDILSITVGANETSKFWLGMLNDLRNRGVKEELFFCVDGLPALKMQFRLFIRRLRYRGVSSICCVTLLNM